MAALDWNDNDIAALGKRAVLFRVRSDRKISGLQRVSDHLRGGVFGAAIILALVAAYVFASGGAST